MFELALLLLLLESGQLRASARLVLLQLLKLTLSDGLELLELLVQITVDLLVAGNQSLQFFPELLVFALVVRGPIVRDGGLGLLDRGVLGGALDVSVLLEPLEPGLHLLVQVGPGGLGVAGVNW
jgi:hypothetical protein